MQKHQPQANSGGIRHCRPKRRGLSHAMLKQVFPSHPVNPTGRGPAHWWSPIRSVRMQIDTPGIDSEDIAVAVNAMMEHRGHGTCRRTPGSPPEQAPACDSASASASEPAAEMPDLLPVIPDLVPDSPPAAPQGLDTPQTPSPRFPTHAAHPRCVSPQQQQQQQMLMMHNPYPRSLSPEWRGETFGMPDPAMQWSVLLCPPPHFTGLGPVSYMTYVDTAGAARLLG